mmetsp:Transcript_31836/g.62624  ORF Transcript_31836/g.62624 Transcript_31836/m.62624 type:complete len:158 (-) Transcript_31836:213-686(-)|eukprot:CAMPEP_0172712522 /NCGR_PEP_ID=MMETSP1074-20121228/61148_1 /TAXON_ID=2916 /ORGANISM="Ceratium fusus, Strain PA161109" /LENGTH=157 /DNA_ID=CAMNT_0013536463 /DNA_START=84 /DNA_END=557 /DNA_ORIENTATION=-
MLATPANEQCSGIDVHTQVVIEQEGDALHLLEGMSTKVGGAQLLDLQTFATPTDVTVDAWTAANEEKRMSALVAARYSDKAQGLSLHDRLCQLEFSDDEDEDDDEDESRHRVDASRLKQASNSANQFGEIETPISKQQPQVVVEYCESFVPPESDDD